MHRPLRQRQARDPAFVQRQSLLDLGHPRPQHELTPEVVEVPVRRTRNRAKQVAPRRVGVGMLPKEVLHTAAKRVLTHEVVELLEHRRRLVVDDRTVVALGLIEVAKFLPERRRPRRLVHAVGERLVAEVEGLPCVAHWIELVERLGRHVRGESLLEPEVVEPPHGDQVAEPHVGDFVENCRKAAKPARERGALAEDEPVLVVEDGAGVLHAAKGKGGGEDEVELLERVGSPEVRLHPRDGALVHGEERVEVGFAGP